MRGSQLGGHRITSNSKASPLPDKRQVRLGEVRTRLQMASQEGCPRPSTLDMPLLGRGGNRRGLGNLRTVVASAILPLCGEAKVSREVLRHREEETESRQLGLDNSPMSQLVCTFYAAKEGPLPNEEAP